MIPIRLAVPAADMPAISPPAAPPASHAPCSASLLSCVPESGSPWNDVRYRNLTDSGIGIRNAMSSAKY